MTPQGHNNWARDDHETNSLYKHELNSIPDNNNERNLNNRLVRVDSIGLGGQSNYETPRDQHKYDNEQSRY